MNTAQNKKCQVFLHLKAIKSLSHGISITSCDSEGAKQAYPYASVTSTLSVSLSEAVKILIMSSPCLQLFDSFYFS